MAGQQQAFEAIEPASVATAGLNKQTFGGDSEPTVPDPDRMIPGSTTDLSVHRSPRSASSRPAVALRQGRRHHHRPGAARRQPVRADRPARPRAQRSADGGDGRRQCPLRPGQRGAGAGRAHREANMVDEVRAAEPSLHDPRERVADGAGLKPGVGRRASPAITIGHRPPTNTLSPGFPFPASAAKPSRSEFRCGDPGGRAFTGQYFAQYTSVSNELEQTFCAFPLMQAHAQ